MYRNTTFGTNFADVLLNVILTIFGGNSGRTPPSKRTGKLKNHHWGICIWSWTYSTAQTFCTRDIIQISVSCRVTEQHYSTELTICAQMESRKTCIPFYRLYFQMHLFLWLFSISIRRALRVFLNGLIHNKTTLVQMMARDLTKAKPLFVRMMPILAHNLLTRKYPRLMKVLT